MNTEKSSSQVAFELLEQGYKQFESKDFEAALNSCQAALVIYEAIGDQRSVGYCLTNMANVYRSQVIHLYNQAISTFNKNGFKEDEEMIIHSLKASLEDKPNWYVLVEGNMVEWKSQSSQKESSGGDPDPDGSRQRRISIRGHRTASSDSDASSGGEGNGD